MALRGFYGKAKSTAKKTKKTARKAKRDAERAEERARGALATGEAYIEETRNRHYQASQEVTERFANANEKGSRAAEMGFGEFPSFGTDPNPDDGEELMDFGFDNPVDGDGPNDEAPPWMF